MLDEVRQVLGLVEARLLDVVPMVYREARSGARARVYPGHARRVPAFLQFGSWIGGDRDGHPNVTHAVTADAVRLQQETILKHYLHRVEDLGSRLSHSAPFVEAGPALAASLAADAALMPGVSAGKDHEPYRAKCRMIAAKLRRTLAYVRAHVVDWGAEESAPPPGVYLGRAGLLADLTVIADDLHRAGATAAANGAVRDLIRAGRGVRPAPAARSTSASTAAGTSRAIDEVLRRPPASARTTATLSPDERFDAAGRGTGTDPPADPGAPAFLAETRRR